MRSHRYLLFALAFILCLHSVAATARHPIVIRQDDSSSQGSQTPSVTADESSRPSSTAAPQETSIEKTSSARPSTAKAAATGSVLSTGSAVTVSATTIASNAPSTSTSAAADANLLPIQPKITPALGLAGVIMLISGAVYGVIGIKNKWLYVFSSAAYLTSLSVTVLIIYLMSPPVSKAVQGAFFVAAFLTGLIFGALSLVFADITDGLGCLLGGFCLSMWFLTLKEGGLIASTSGRAIFIGCMSLAGYALSWSHYTRNYGLIGSISFAGATITMLGVDCFSRAGWKEFWLYLWNLNPNTFPLFTNTYPLTRGIKVELAGVVILCIFGIVSQLRLWKLIKERREKTAAQRLEREQYQEREEEELGRRIEDNFQRERAQWEATYGDKTLNESIVDSVHSPKRSTSVREKESFRSDSVELTPLPKDAIARSASKRAAVTVAVLQEDDIQQIDSEGNPVMLKQSESTSQPSAPVSGLSSARMSSDISAPGRLSRSISTRSSLQPSARPPPPIIVPLPFKVPNEDDVQTQQSDNASISPLPDTEEDALSKRRSVSKRLSDISGMKRLSSNRASPDRSESEEALMIPHVEDDRASSVAATLDEVDNVSLAELSLPHSPLNLDFDVGAPRRSVAEVTDDIPARLNSGEKPDIGDETSSLLPLAPRQSLTISTDPKSGLSHHRESLQSPRRRSDTVVSVIKEDKNKSQLSNSMGSDPQSPVEPNESVSGSLTGALPGKLSKVAQSYRTNEWAKHLEAAEKPDLDDIPEPASPGIQIEHERPAPVSEEIAPPLVVAKRSSHRVSSGSNIHRNSDVLRNGSKTSRNSQTDLQPMSRTPSVLAAGGISRSGSQIHDRPARNSATQLQPVLEPAASRLSSAPSPQPNGTLMGQRETRLQNRASSQSFIPHSASANSLATVGESDMSLAQRKRALQHQKPPSASQKWQQNNWAAENQIQEFDSHQPKRTTGYGSDQRREDLLAGWRESIRQDATPPQTAVMSEEQRRIALVNAKRQKEMEKQQQTMVAQQRESMMHNMMRSNEMLDAHREAMRRMQAAANRNAS